MYPAAFLGASPKVKELKLYSRAHMLIVVSKGSVMWYKTELHAFTWIVEDADIVISFWDPRLENSAWNLLV